MKIYKYPLFSRNAEFFKLNFTHLKFLLQFHMKRFRNYLLYLNLFFMLIIPLLVQTVYDRNVLIRGFGRTKIN